MGINRPRWTASNQELDRAADMAAKASDMLEQLAKAAEMLSVSLLEVKRYRRAIAAETAPLDWSRFVEEVRQKDTTLAEALDVARPARFALGELSLCVQEGRAFALCSLKKEVLTEMLQNRYDCPWKVRVRQQE